MSLSGPLDCPMAQEVAGTVDTTADTRVADLDPVFKMRSDMNPVLKCCRIRMRVSKFERTRIRS